jgi:DNA-binding response OmpR family regulator
MTISLKYVLIAEDDPDIADLLQEAIADRLYVATHVVANGALVPDAIAARRPDLLILDLGLPGLSGNDVFDIVRADPAHAGLPVLVLTASPNAAPAFAPQDRLRVMEKPFDLDALLAAIDAMVDGSVPAAA